MACYTKENNTENVTASTGENVSTSNSMSPAVLTTAEVKATIKKCYEMLTKAGCSSAFAKGVLSNFYAESSFQYSLLTWDGNNVDKFGIGGGLIGFYYHGRLKELANLIDGNENRINTLNDIVKTSGLPRPNVAGSEKNKQYIMNTLKKSFPYTLEQQMRIICEKYIKLKGCPINSSSEKDSAEWFMLKIERPAKENRIDRWAKYGNTILNALK